MDVRRRGTALSRPEPGASAYTYYEPGQLHGLPTGRERLSGRIRRRRSSISASRGRSLRRSRHPDLAPWRSASPSSSRTPRPATRTPSPGTSATATTSTGTEPRPRLQHAGAYTVSLTATNPLHTGTLVETDYITVYDGVDASFTANQTGGPAPLHVKFTDTSTGGPTSWLWNFGDGVPLDKQNPVYTYHNPGNYDVDLTASNGYSTEKSTKLHFVITVYGDLAAQFTENQTAGPNPLTVQFNDTTTRQPDGVGMGLRRRRDIHREEPGPYLLRSRYLQCGPEGESPPWLASSAPVPITVYDPSQRSSTSTSRRAVCPSRSSSRRTSTGRRGHLEMGLRRRLAVSTEPNPVHAYTAPGTYTANLTVWNHLRPDLASTTVPSRSSSTASPMPPSRPSR